MKDRKFFAAVEALALQATATPEKLSHADVQAVANGYRDLLRQFDEMRAYVCVLGRLECRTCGIVYEAGVNHTCPTPLWPTAQQCKRCDTQFPLGMEHECRMPTTEKRVRELVLGIIKGECESGTFRKAVKEIAVDILRNEINHSQIANLSDEFRNKVLDEAAHACECGGDLRAADIIYGLKRKAT